MYGRMWSMLRRTRDHLVAAAGLTVKISESLSAMSSRHSNHVVVVAAMFAASGGGVHFSRRTFLLRAAIVASPPTPLFASAQMG